MLEDMIKKLKRIPRVLKVLKGYLLKDESVILSLLEEEAKDLLKELCKVGVSSTEDLEDLLFHIRSYFDIPKTTKELMFPDMREIKFKFNSNGDVRIDVKGPDPTEEELKTFIDYICEVEKQKAVERDFICEHMKKLSLDFSI